MGCAGSVGAFHIFGLRPFITLCDDERDALAIAQAAAPLTPDGAKMYKYLLPVVLGDKTEALGGCKGLERRRSSKRVPHQLGAELAAQCFSGIREDPSPRLLCIRGGRSDKAAFCRDGGKG